MAKKQPAPPPSIEFRPLDGLIPYARNSRTHSEAQVAQIAASMAEFGWTVPILADAAGIVAGHGRALAAARIYAGGGSIKMPSGFPIPAGHAPVIDCTGWNKAQRRAYVIADNRLPLNAAWDMDMLSVELGGLQDDGFDLGVLGFDADELRDLLGNAAEAGLPDLADGEKEPFQQMTFTLHDYQAEQVLRALAKAKEMGAFVDSPNDNSNGNALARICELFITQGRK